MSDGKPFERNGIWYICYHHRGTRHRESVVKAGYPNTEKAARTLLRERLTDLGRGKTSVLTAGKLTFEAIAEAFLNDCNADHRLCSKRPQPDKPCNHLKNAQKTVEHLREFFGDDLAIDIKTSRIRQFRAEMQEKHVRGKKGYSVASINRYLAALRRMFNLINEGEENIIPVPHFPMFEEHNTRERMIEPADFEHLLTFLPDYLRLPIEFAYEVSWRKGEFRDLEWRDVALVAREIRLRIAHDKAGTGRVIPLTGRRLEIIQAAHAQRRLDCPYVFHRNGEYIGDFKKAWATACKKAGQQGLRVHDLRHAGATIMNRAGMDQTTIMNIAGWKTDAMFRRYQIKNTRTMVLGFDRLDAYRDRQPVREALQARAAATPKVVPLTARETPQLRLSEASFEPTIDLPTENVAGK